ncbi:hypothetical protein ABIF68_002519 [Bradyrhizobium japonicum]
MNLLRTNGLAAIGRLLLFVAIGALLGYIQMLLATRLSLLGARLDEAPETHDFLPDLIDVIKVLFALLLIQCLLTIAALASWKFELGDTYWKALVLGLLVLFLNVFLDLVLLPRFIPDVIMNNLNDAAIGSAQLRAFIETRPAWDVLLIGVMIITEAALDVFATFAFVIRAMIVRSGKWAGLVFLLIGTIASSCLILSVDSAATSLLQFPFLLGLSALAFRVLPKKSSAPTIQTHLVEAR